MKNQPDMQASILDRLIDLSPQLSREPVQRRFTTLLQVREAVLRDLENLLNSRRRIDPAPPSVDLVAESIYSYGVRDFISHCPRSGSVRQQIRQEIERNLKLFEPRLKEVTVRLDNSSADQRNLHFQITALLVAEPVAAPITFDTCVDTNSGAYSVHSAM